MDFAANREHSVSVEVTGVVLRVKPCFNELGSVELEVWFAQNLILSVQLPLLE